MAWTNLHHRQLSSEGELAIYCDYVYPLYVAAQNIR
jgi:hypothetical protein